MEPIHTLLVVDDDVIARMGSMVRHLCVGMIDESVQLTVLSRSAGDRVKESIGPARAVTLPRQRWPWRRPTSQSVLKTLGDRKPDIVHAMSGELTHWVHPWCSDWASVLVMHLADLEDVAQFADFKADMQAMALAVTAGIEQALLERSPQKREQVRVVPPGLPAESEPACLASPDRVPTVVVTAPLRRHCGLEVVFKALKSIVKTGQEVQLFILSTGRAERYFRRQVDELDLRSCVTFAGQMRDWATFHKAMVAADFYLSPAASERFTISGLTALAGGLAILAPAGTTEDYFIDGKTASLFDPLRPKQLADKWSALLKDPDAARRLARGALEYARAHHQASMMVSGTAALYRHLCSARHAGQPT